MSGVRLFLLWLQWKLLRRPSVIIFDFDGQMNARLALGIRRHRHAKRFGFGIHNVRLLSGGKTHQPDYVKRWEPLFPPTFEI